MKYGSLLLFILYFTFACSDNQREEVLLHANWQFAQGGQTEKYPAQVPGTVHTDLLANGLIPDPFYANNEADLQWIEKESWVYENTFSVTKKQLQSEQIELLFEGLDTYADVFLNDQLILQADNMFRSWAVDVKDHLIQGNNALKIIFNSAVVEAQNQMEKLPYRLPGKEEAYTRKAAYQYGWDWGPRFATAGVWKDIKLQFWNTARIKEVQIVQQILSDDQAKLIVMPNIQNTSGTDLSYEISILDGDSLLLKQVQKLNANSYKVSSKITIPNPKRWWTHQLGDPHLYKVQVALLESGNQIDFIEKQIGLRTIELVQEKDSIGSSFYFKLNGVPVYAKGANIIPQDNFLPRVTKDKYEQLLDNALDANMNRLRVWGGGIYEQDVFYELCDQKGLLVWQDFMFACTLYRGDSAFVKNVQAEVSEQIKRLRHHPSIALWCGNNEIIEGWNNWGWQKQLGYSQEDSAQLIQDYQNLFEELIPNLVAEHDPQRAYHPSSPANGWGRERSYQEADVHYWGVWWGMEPFEQYKEKVGRFVSEYGFQGMPAMSSFRQFVPKDELFLNSPAVKAHQKHPKGFETIAEYMARDFPVPNDFEKYIYVSQLLQARGISMAIEAHRAAKPYNMGTLYWQLNDCWPVTSWSSIDYYGTPKALHYAVRKAFDDLLIIVEKGQIKIVSDLIVPVDAQLKVALVDFDGNLIDKNDKPIQIAASSAQYYMPIDFLVSDSSRSLLHIQLIKGDRLLTEKLHYFSSPKYLQLESPEILVKSISDTELEIETMNYLAKNIYLQAEGVRFSDNFFDLPLGVKKRIKFTSQKPFDPSSLQIMILNNLLDN